MSEPIRYEVGMTEETNSRTGFYASFPRVYPSEQGRYVEYADYARLRAEVERLTDSITRGAITPDAKKFEPAENDTDYLTVYLYAAELSKDAMKKLKQENAFLKMEVERLKNNAAYLDAKLDEELDK
jgi:cell division protein FtsB